MEAYCYNALPDTIGATRLLHLLPSTDNQAPIRCEIVDYCLQESRKAAHHYEALSYVWGPTEPAHKIQVGQGYLNVTPNLHAALLHLRDSDIARTFWIDALCINQADDEEKARQIRFMASIYGKASRVIVWLGEAADDSDEAIEAIRGASRSQDVRDISDIEHTFLNKLFNPYHGRWIPPHLGKDDERPTPPASSGHGAVMMLLRRPWFRRIWVLQEVGAARHILIQCGSAEIDGHAFCLGLDEIQAQRRVEGKLEGVQMSMDTDEELFNQLHAVLNLIRGAISRSRFDLTTTGATSLKVQPLGALLDAYHTHEATQRYDKLYALFGMCTDDLGKHDLIPDYKEPWDQLFRRAMHLVLGKHVQIKIDHNAETVRTTCKGYVLGRIGGNPKYGGGRVTVAMNWADDFYGSHSYMLDLPVSANPIRIGDILCMLEGMSWPTIVRRHGNHFSAIVLAATPLKMSCPPWIEWNSALPMDLLRDFSFTWTLGRHAECYEECLTEPITPSWLLNVGWILRDVHLLDDAQSKVLEAIDMCGPPSHGMHSFPVSGQQLVKFLLAFPDEAIIAFLKNTALNVCVSEEVILAVIKEGSWRTSTADKLSILLRDARNEIHVTEAFLLAAASNSSGYGMVKVLIEYQDHNLPITEAVLSAAVNSYEDSTKTVELLLDHQGKDAEISESLIMRAAREGRCEVQTMQTLLERKGKEFHVTDSLLIEAISGNSSNDLVEYLLEYPGTEVHITEQVLLAAVYQNTLRNGKTIDMLLDLGGANVEITETVLLAIVFTGQLSILQKLLEHKDADIEITKPVLVAALVGKGPQAYDNVKLILHKLKVGFQITESVITAAARNTSWGSVMLDILLDLKGVDIKLTEEIIQRIVEPLSESYRLGVEQMLFDHLKGEPQIQPC